jgi:hypothetical protein
VIIVPGAGKPATPLVAARFEPDTFAVKIGTDRPEANFLITCEMI